ncbi:DUF2188 domain-containing protein [Cobetia sp. 1CM21F]|uniref:DUF2188 domain-containing protein n=1 Tax=Cobetia sp. 1CM21F TaxID=2929163 RepID=UPI0020BEA58D|nr:DUF2188 domain-containing protein [Cobetia sp. 1CM21F]MCK8068090.1 DUF2188 domain-containing protein [Cobetia sp. 1CM21F]
MMIEMYFYQCSDGWAVRREYEDIPHKTFKHEEEAREYAKTLSHIKGYKLYVIRDGGNGRDRVL